MNFKLYNNFHLEGKFVQKIRSNCFPNRWESFYGFAPVHIQSLIVIIVHACILLFHPARFFSRSVPLTATYFHRSFRLAVSYYLKFPIIGLALSSFEDPCTRPSPTRTRSSFTGTRLSRKRSAINPCDRP